MKKEGIVVFLFLALFLVSCSQEPTIVKPQTNDSDPQIIDTCGNGICEKDEVETCSQDCDMPVVENKTTASCGDNICDSNEIGNCLQDCPEPETVDIEEECGNGICEKFEISQNSCPQDCGG